MTDDSFTPEEVAGLFAVARVLLDHGLIVNLAPRGQWPRFRLTRAGRRAEADLSTWEARLGDMGTMILEGMAHDQPPEGDVDHAH